MWALNFSSDTVGSCENWWFFLRTKEIWVMGMSQQRLEGRILALWRVLGASGLVTVLMKYFLKFCEGLPLTLRRDRCFSLCQRSNLWRGRGRHSMFRHEGFQQLFQFILLLWCQLISRINLRMGRSSSWTLRVCKRWNASCPRNFSYHGGVKLCLLLLL